MNKRKIWILLMVFSLFLFGTRIGWAIDSTADLPNEVSVKKAVSYLKSLQNPDGGFSARPGQSSSRALTSWVIMGLRAAGEDMGSSRWMPAGKTPVDFLYSCQEPVEATCDCARLLIALAAANEGSGAQAQNLADKIVSFQQEEGQFTQPGKGEQGMNNAHIWSILALASVQREIPQMEKARQWLLDKQNQDGGFGWLEGIESDADDTAVAIQALLVLGEKPETSSAIKNALRFLENLQQIDGGFSAGEWMGKESNASSDAWVIQGLIAAGENPQDSVWTVDGKTAVTHLLELQNDDGSFDWKKGVSSSPATTTAYAVMALAGKTFPVNANWGNYLEDSGFSKCFTDLSNDHWAYDAVMKLVEAKVLGGYPDKTFRPEKPVTRAEFTKFIVSGLGLPDSNSDGAERFKDVQSQHWAYRFISTAVEQELIKGRPDGTFGINGQITGAELSAMLVRALPPARVSTLQEGSLWYSGYVKLAAEEGMLYPGFRADAPATRAQCAFSIEQLIRLTEME